MVAIPTMKTKTRTTRKPPPKRATPQKHDRVCAWCGCILEADCIDDTHDSHGICEDCRKKRDANERRELAEAEARERWSAEFDEWEEAA